MHISTQYFESSIWQALPFAMELATVFSAVSAGSSSNLVSWILSFGLGIELCSFVCFSFSASKLLVRDAATEFTREVVVEFGMLVEELLNLA